MLETLYNELYPMIFGSIEVPAIYEALFFGFCFLCVCLVVGIPFFIIYSLVRRFL